MGLLPILATPHRNLHKKQKARLERAKKPDYVQQVRNRGAVKRRQRAKEG